MAETRDHGSENLAHPNETGTDSSDYMTEARERFDCARRGWEEQRREFTLDLKFTTGDQWDSALKSRKESDGTPALVFNRTHPIVRTIVNRQRQERPQIHFQPGDGGNPETAAFFEDKVRHIQYASHADLAYDNAAEYQAGGGFAFFRVTIEPVGKPGKGIRSLEPRIGRILDPLTVDMDPDFFQPDGSDMQYCFVGKYYKREVFRKTFKREAVPFDNDHHDPNWGDKDGVWVREYWYVTLKTRRYVQLDTGEHGYADELEVDEATVVDSEELEERQVHCDIIDGSGPLEKNDWPGAWIPIVLVVGEEVVVEGKRQFISAIRYARDPQKLLNAVKSSIAGLLAMAQRAPIIGPKGTFKDQKWRDWQNRNYAYMEWDQQYGQQGQPLPPPTRVAFEAPIQALSQAAIAEADDIKATVGYADALLQPSRSDLSGIAIGKRDAQQDLTNFHFSDNMVASQWHAGRILQDLIVKLADRPRGMQVMGKDRKTRTVPVTMQMQDGQVYEAQGFEGQPHHQIDTGDYNCIIETGKGYAAKREEETQVLLQAMQADPALWQIYGDVLFELLGYPELAERAKIALPPQIQQAISGQQQGLSPAAQQQIAQANAQVKQLLQIVQKLMGDRQGKMIDNQGKLQVQRLKTAGDIIVQDAKHRHEAATTLLQEHTDTIEHIMSLLHESEMAPPKPGEPGWQPPQAQGGAGQ